MKFEDKMPKMIMWGATGQAKVLRECMSYSGWILDALFDNNRNIVSPFSDVPLLFGEESFKEWVCINQEKIGQTGFLVAVGGFKGIERLNIQNYLETFGLLPLKAIHPTAAVAKNAKIENGSQILMHASIAVDVHVGKACIVNTGASVDHECKIDDGVHICPGVHIAGCVDVKKYASVGTGAVILPRITIGEGAVIGAGAVVLHNIAPYTMWAGNPARFIKNIG